MGWSTSRDIQLVSGLDKIATQRIFTMDTGQQLFHIVCELRLVAFVFLRVHGSLPHISCFLVLRIFLHMILNAKHWHIEGQVWSSNIQKYSSSPYGQSGNESHASSGETHISEFLHFTYPGHDVLLQLFSSNPFGHSHFPLHTYFWGIQYDSGHLKYFVWHLNFWHRMRSSDYSCFPILLVHHGILDSPFSTVYLQYKILLPSWQPQGC